MTNQRINEILRFEQLLSEISAIYINLPPEQINKVMRNDLGRLARLLGADRCILYKLNQEAGYFKPYLHSGWWPDKDNDLVLGMNRYWVKDDSEFFKNFEFLYEKWHRGESFQWNQRDTLSEKGERMKRAYKKFGVKSQLSIPISVGGATVGVLSVADTRFHKKWPEELVPRLRLFGEVFENALARKQSEEAIQKALLEVKRLKARIEADYIYLTEEIKRQYNFEEIIGESAPLKSVLLKVAQVAPTDAAVLISGETGTGKELVARAIHNAGGRKTRPLIKVDCATLSPNLIESELFGHEKGAFTGAAAKRVGRFELAQGATLFLDEIGELPLELQPKLLRVLQDGEFNRVGGSLIIKTDARIITATNRDLQREVEAGNFRRDLWYRLNAFPIFVPPLRQRLDDIPLFLNFFVNKYGHKVGKRFDLVSQKIIKRLQGYAWPGNVRELENLIQRSVITSMNGKLEVDIPQGFEAVNGKWKSLRNFEREYIVKVLNDCHWIIEGNNGAARRLGINASTLRNRMKKLDIKRPARF